MMERQPQPKVALNNICAIIYNNTLYTYSSDAFQSLELEKGATWKSLPLGESVTGGVCVGSTPTDDTQAGFFVVGGTGNSTDYNGLQKYTYSTGEWTSITPAVTVTKNRLNHGASYINSSNAIVVYAGSQDGDANPSTQTFSIRMTSPYSVLAYQSIASPAVRPILLPWSESQAVMVGGSTTNTKVMLFSLDKGWADSGATLASPLQTGDNPWRAAIVTGDDGSKNLYTFDMSISPNVANRTVLVDGSGSPVTNSKAITKRFDGSGGAERVERGEDRDLTASNWPDYNSTYASTSTRTNYAAAEDGAGTVVLAGGNDDDVLCIFNGKTNSWINATEKLSDQRNLVMSISSSSSSTSATATATSSATGSSANAAESTTAAASPSSSSKSSSGLSTNSLLGVILGSIAGIIVLLALIYCQIRKRKRKADFIQAAHARRDSGTSAGPEKEGMAFANDSFPRSPTNGTFARGHNPGNSTSSYSSMAILMGKVNQQKQSGHHQSTSFGSNRQFKATISGPKPQASQSNLLSPVPAAAMSPRDEKVVSFTADTADARATPRQPGTMQDGTRRSSGWNRYWSGDSALNILGYGTNRNTVASEGSHYSTSNADALVVSNNNEKYNRITQDSATVPPLNVDGRPRFSHVNSASPTVENFPQRFTDAMSGTIGSDREDMDDDTLSGYSSGIPASVHDTWDPTAPSSKQWGAPPRAPSSVYSSHYNSTMFSKPPLPTGAGDYPPLPTGRGVPSGISQQPQLDQAHTSDMSWLNLGEQKGQR